MAGEAKRLMTFIVLAKFGARRDKLGISDIELARLQRNLIAEAGDVIQGSRGVRKVRPAREDARKGKSGGYRTIYLHGRCRPHRSADLGTPGLALLGSP